MGGYCLVSSMYWPGVSTQHSSISINPSRLPPHSMRLRTSRLKRNSLERTGGRHKEENIEIWPTRLRHEKKCSLQIALMRSRTFRSWSSNSTATKGLGDGLRRRPASDDC